MLDFPDATIFVQDGAELPSSRSRDLDTLAGCGYYRTLDRICRTDDLMENLPMRQDDVTEYLKRRPFQPFRLHLSTGAFFDIHQPELA